MDVRGRGFQKRASVHEVHQKINEAVSPLKEEVIPFYAALHRVSSRDLRAKEMLPAYDRSLVDGYALLEAPQNMRTTWANVQKIKTGENLPAHTYAVAMIEKTETEEAFLKLKNELTKGENILFAGDDFKTDQIVLHQAHRFRAQDISLCASLGFDTVHTYKQPRVLIMPTGSEIVPFGSPKGSDQIIESNSYMLEALLKRDGASVKHHSIVSDDPILLTQALKEALIDEFDLILMIGGTSVGPSDFTQTALKSLGEVWFHGISMKPGSPTGLGVIKKGHQQTYVLMLPGFPVASYAAYDLFGRALLQRLQGLQAFWPYPQIQAKWAKTYTKPKNQTQLVRVSFLRDLKSNQPQIAPLVGGASQLSSLSSADGFVILDDCVEICEADQAVEVFVYDLASNPKKRS